LRATEDLDDASKRGGEVELVYSNSFDFRGPFLVLVLSTAQSKLMIICHAFIFPRKCDRPAVRIPSECRAAGADSTRPEPAVPKRIREDVDPYTTT
jgi:hypothetical protein